MTVRRAIGLMLAVGVLAGAADAHASRGAERLLALHATRGADPGIFDSRGRQVLLRGVNVNGLGDYFQANPDFEPVVPLRRSDFRRIARIGFNSVRLIVHWSRLEPERGAFNRDYVRRIHRVVGWANRRGLYVILDMHQDAWGKYIATPPEEVCAPGFSPNNGWDGAPEWATLTDGLPTCKLSLRELSPAVGQAWESFWADRDGIQTELVSTWAKLAHSFAADPGIAGYDLLNEPNPGFTPGGTDASVLGEFYGRAIAAIRVAEASAPDGFSHIAFFEPGVIWSAAATDAVPAPSFTADTNIVFAPHIYAESIAVGATIGQGFAYAKQAADTYGVTVWSGEWGFFGDPAAQEGPITRYGAAEDDYAYGGAWWDWKQACGDPHVIGAPGGEPGSLSPSLVRIECPSEKALGISPEFRLVLSRAVPRAVPGRITALTSDPSGPGLHLEGRTADPACGLRIFVPLRGGRPRVTGDGLTRVKLERVHEDWIVRGCVKGAYEVDVAPAATR